MTDSVTTGAAVFELARFEWAKPDRIEIEGTWSGVRGRRFIRPTLVLRGENGEHLRLLATLEHKPWAADDGIAFIAAFKFDGEGPIKFASADLNVAPGLDLELPAPRMRAGNPRRFRPRIEAHDATAGDAERRAAAAAAAGIVTEVPAPADPVTPDIDPPAPAVDPPQPDPDPGPNVDPAPNVDPPHPDPDSAAARGDLAPATSEAELDRLRAARDAMRRERDSALDKLRAVRKELEAERQAREDAVAEARASERASANSMLSQGAELRAAVERQRALAYEARDEAQQQRDNAIAARDRGS